MAEHPVLVAAARHGLGEPAGPAVRLDPDELPEVLRIARMDRLGGFLATAVAAGVVDADAETTEAIDQLWHDQLVVVVLAESIAIGVAACLDDAGVRWRLTKGSALAHLDYPDPAVRLFGDVDLIVHPDSWDTALRALGEVGWRREAAELDDRFDQSFGKGATLTSPEGYEVDLHRRLAIGRFGVRLPTEALFTDVDVVRLGGREVPVLDGPSRLLHACYHASLGGFRHLRAARDVAQLVLIAEADWETTRRVAERHRVEAVVADGLIESWARLELSVRHPAHEWALSQSIGRADAHALRVFGEERPFREQALTAVPVLVGHGSVRYLRALARQRGRTPIGPRTMVRRARRALPRRR